jgi:hypothetical protein
MAAAVDGRLAQRPAGDAARGTQRADARRRGRGDIAIRIDPDRAGADLEAPPASAADRCGTMPGGAASATDRFGPPPAISSTTSAPNASVAAGAQAPRTFTAGP